METTSIVWRHFRSTHWSTHLSLMCACDGHLLEQLLTVFSQHLHQLSISVAYFTRSSAYHITQPSVVVLHHLLNTLQFAHLNGLVWRDNGISQILRLLTCKIYQIYSRTLMQLHCNVWLLSWYVVCCRLSCLWRECIVTKWPKLGSYGFHTKVQRKVLTFTLSAWQVWWGHWKGVPSIGWLKLGWGGF